MPKLTAEAFNRFHANINQNMRSRCHVWMGSKDMKGYGRFGCNGKQYLAHRIAFHLATGLEPGYLVVNHKCKNPSCVNPEHLERITDAENRKYRMSHHMYNKQL